MPLLERRLTVVLFDHMGSRRPDPSSWSERRHSTIDGCAEDVLGPFVPARIPGSGLITPNATRRCPGLATLAETAAATASFAGAGL
ncbi:hypothetical protein OHB05_40215 [Streptomyces sp. NBC_00638]|uniref:hypothetical protein n=1 Tax=unclassified Streptomyces TaxID=2593676 RepID=UPI00224D54D1|nr:hypothetical protein [Streptomyces sp. NBC_00638]MCX5008753.1 hypothetical protein [Streptomyces sp. NBC_00638]